MHYSQIFKYSLKNLQKLSQKHNQYYSQDFSKNDPNQALTDFHRQNYFANYHFFTKGCSDEKIKKQILDFLEGNLALEEQKILKNFLCARGGQSLSAEISRELVNSIFLSDYPFDAYIPIDCVELALYSPIPRNKSAIRRVDIQLHYITLAKIKGVTTACIMDKATNSLKEIDSIEQEKIQDILQKISSSFIASQEYIAMQEKLLEEKDSLTLTKAIEKVIEEKTGLVPVVFACSQREIKAMAKPDWEASSQIFKKKNHINYDNLPNLQNRVLINMKEMVLGSNVTTINFKPNILKKNELSKSEHEKDDTFFHQRSYSRDYSNFPSSTSVSLLDEFINILRKIIDDILMKYTRKPRDLLLRIGT